MASSSLFPAEFPPGMEYIEEYFNDQILLPSYNEYEFPSIVLQQETDGVSAELASCRKPSKRQTASGQRKLHGRPELDKVARRIQRKDKHRRIELRRRGCERKLFEDLRQMLGADRKHRVAVLEECLKIVQVHLQLKAEKPDLFREFDLSSPGELESCSDQAREE